MGGTQAAMARQKRHSKVEIATKLAQANDLARQGKVQSVYYLNWKWYVVI